MRTISGWVLAAGLVMAGLARPAAAENTIYPALKGDLVTSKGKRLAKFDDAPLAQAKYYAIYYSASWCGPCRAFTPDLVRWYKRQKAQHPEFELIFVSSDRSEEDMAQYMKGDDMPWPALAFDKKDRNKVLTKYSGPGIPCLVFIDETGKVLSDSYQGRNYIGPRKVLEDMDKILQAGGTASTASASPPQGGGTRSAGSSGFDDFFKKKPAQ